MAVEYEPANVLFVLKVGLSQRYVVHAALGLIEGLLQP